MEEKTPWSRGLFKLGDRVTWSSQANGCTVQKEGVVVEVVEACTMPKGAPKGSGMMRDHESYVIQASKTTDRKRTGRYWPLVRGLRKIYEVFNEQALRDEIIKTWGPAGDHIDVYDMLLKKAGIGIPDTWPGHPGEAG